MHRLWLTVAILVTCSSITQAENWPGWRGPRGDGTSAESNIPVKWDATTNHNIA